MLTVNPGRGTVHAERAGINAGRRVHEAMHYRKLNEYTIQCQLCPWECEVTEAERGICGVRENVGGKYYTVVYGKPCTANPSDPIEKKPLFHYLPGSTTFSIATAGCNISCKYCQNWQISQSRPEQVASVDMPPEAVVRYAALYGCATIAYTYSEPVIFYEYMYDTARLSRKQGIGGVMISNGFIKKEPLKQLCDVLTGVKIDFKGFSEKFYHEICRGQLKPVLETLKTLKEVGIWFEIVILIIPTLNDSEQENSDMCKWIADNLGPDVPVHFSRFSPKSAYALRNLPRTPIATLERCHELARAAGLRYAYLGNVPGHRFESTYCPQCGKRLIHRRGFWVSANLIGKDGKCPGCGTKVPGVWKNPLA